MSQRSPITTHVLDTALGRPAEGIAIRLERMEDVEDPPKAGAPRPGGVRAEGAGGPRTVKTASGWREIAAGVTNADGRVADLLEPGALPAGTYRITFETGDYLSRSGRAGFYPYVQVVFTIDAPDQHYHVPLLLSPFGFSTYRGS